MDFAPDVYVCIPHKFISQICMWKYCRVSIFPFRLKPRVPADKWTLGYIARADVLKIHEALAKKKKKPQSNLLRQK